MIWLPQVGVDHKRLIRCMQWSSQSVLLHQMDPQPLFVNMQIQDTRKTVRSDLTLSILSTLFRGAASRQRLLPLRDLGSHSVHFRVEISRNARLFHERLQGITIASTHTTNRSLRRSSTLLNNTVNPTTFTMVSLATSNGWWCSCESSRTEHEITSTYTTHAFPPSSMLTSLSHTVGRRRAHRS